MEKPVMRKMARRAENRGMERVIRMEKAGMKEESSG
jgi:hypothetical protein